MNKPITNGNKKDPEKVIEEKIQELADSAESIEEIDRVQRLIKNQVDIKESKKVRLLGIEVKDWFVGVVSMSQLLAILKFEDMKVLTSKALNFVHKGRLR